MRPTSRRAIGADVLMRSTKSVMDLSLKLLKKEFKDKRFAAGCLRNVIRQGAELCGRGLDELMQCAIDAMRSLVPDCDTVAAEQGFQRKTQTRLQRRS